MKTFLLLLTISSIGYAGTVFFGLDSGVTAPLSANDNLHYNPSVYVQPSLFLRISENTLLSASYGYVFAREGELIKDTGIWGDEYGNYNTDLHFVKFGVTGELASIDLGGGLGIWSYRTDRDIVGE